jgi:hypothetical protein
VTTLRRTPRLEEDLSFRIRCDERIELGANADLAGGLSVDVANLSDDRATTMIDANAGVDEIRAAKAILPEEV